MAELAIGNRIWRAWRTLPERFGRPQGSLRYIPQVDGIRFLAILLVFFWHGSLRCDRYVQRLHLPSLYRLFPHGEIGVDLFFLLSGMVIAEPLLRQGAKLSIASFYRKRFRRIYPPYLVSLLLCFLILALSHHAPEGARSFAASHIPLGASLLASAAYLHSLVFDAPSRLNPPMWSLEIEIQFYLLAPWLLLLYSGLRGRAARLLSLASLILLLIAGGAALHTVSVFDNRFRHGLLIYAPYFLGGIVLAELERPGGPFSAIPESRRWDLVLGAGLLGLFSLGWWFCSNDAHPQGFLANAAAPLVGLPAAAAVYFGALHGRLGRVCFGAPWPALLGAMCYSLYLTHIVVVQAVSELLLGRLHLHNRLAVWGVWLPALAAAVFVFGLLFYVLVERPFMSGGKRAALARAQLPGPEEPLPAAAP